MQFKNVVIQSLAAIDAPIKITSTQIAERLRPAMERLGIRQDLLENITGIGARRVWDHGTQPSDAATLAAEKAIADAGIERDKIGVLINTSVCRDFLEPSTACLVHGNLNLHERCLNFDIGNACLAFLNGMDVAARMIERGEVEYALIVDAELTAATGYAERDTAVEMLARLPASKRRRTIAADKAYDTRDFVARTRGLGFTPHVAQNTTNRRSAIDGRTTRHAGHVVSQRIRK